MFAFSQIEPRTGGQVSHETPPLGRYLGAAFDQGWEDSAFASVEHMTEMSLADTGPGIMESLMMTGNEIHAAMSKGRISAEEANKKYALPGLTFDQPVVEAQARLINERRQKDLERSYYLDEADTSPGRWVGGLGVRIAAGMMNPLDLGVNFFPVVGSEERAANLLGRGGRFAGPRAALARGLIAEESLKGLPAPRLMSAMISGTVGQAVLELPVAVSKVQGMQEYTSQDALVDVIGGGIFAGGLHLAFEGAGRLWRKLRPETREVMLRQAIDQFAKGEDISVHDFVKIDENAIRDKVKFDPDSPAVQAAALEHVEQIMPGLRDALKKKYPHEDIVSAASRDPDGKVYTGPIHPMIWDELRDTNREIYEKWVDEGRPDVMKGWEDGFVTTAGRFVSRDEAAKLTGYGETMDAAQLDPDLGVHYDLQKAVNEGLESARAFRKKEYEEHFFDRPDVKAELKAQVEKEIADFIEKKRAEHDPEKAFSEAVQAEIARQQKDGKLLTEEQVKKYTAKPQAEASDIASVEEDTARIMDELGITEEDIKGEGEKATEKSSIFDYITTKYFDDEGHDPNYPIMVDDIINNDKLLKKYPYLSSVAIKLVNDSNPAIKGEPARAITLGDGEGTIFLNRKYWDDALDGRSPEDRVLLEQAILHEIAHVVQDKEGRLDGYGTDPKVTDKAEQDAKKFAEKWAIGKAKTDLGKPLPDLEDAIDEAADCVIKNII